MIQKELTGDLQLKWGRMQQAMQKDKCGCMPAKCRCKPVLYNRTCV